MWWGLGFRVRRSIVSSQKAFRGQIKWQLQTQKAALYCIVLLSEWLQTTQLHSNLFHISCSNARVRSQTWSLQTCFPLFPNLCAANMQIVPNAVCQNHVSFLFQAELRTDKPAFIWPTRIGSQTFPPDWKNRVCFAVPFPPFGKHCCCHTELLNLAEPWVQAWSVYQNGSVSTIPAVQRDFVLRQQPPLHSSSPQVFSNSTPLDVWEAQLVVDHKALNHCLLIKHSTQWMRTGESISRVPAMTADETEWPLLVDFITGRYNCIVCTGENGNFTRYYFPGFIAYFLSQHRQGLSTNRIAGGFGIRDYKKIIAWLLQQFPVKGSRLVIGPALNEKQRYSVRAECSVQCFVSLCCNFLHLLKRHHLLYLNVHWSLLRPYFIIPHHYRIKQNKKTPL